MTSATSIDFLFVLAVILGYVGLIGACVMGLVLIIQARHLLRQFRKFASQFPPYPIYEDEEGNSKDATHVKISEQWNDERQGRD